MGVKKWPKRRYVIFEWSLTENHEHSGIFKVSIYFTELDVGFIVLNACYNASAIDKKENGLNIENHLQTYKASTCL